MTRLLCMVIFCLLCLPTPLDASGKVYVWRDANGVLVFSDSPKPGSEEVNLTTKINLMEAPDPFHPRQQEEHIPFSIEITSPEQEATIRDNTGTVHVRGRVQPRFVRGFQIALKVNGDIYGEPQTSTTFILRDHDRGEHQLQLLLLDQSGKQLAESDIITFYLHRRTVIPPR